jgi:antitoxin PrlF
MPTATVTSKGQITIPQQVRDAMGLQAGSKVDFVAADGGFKVVALQTSAPGLKGRFAGRVAKPVSVAAMDRAIAAATGDRDSRATRRAGKR